MPVFAYAIFIAIAFISFIFGVIWASRRIDEVKTFGDIYINENDLYLDANPELLEQPNNRYIILRVVKVGDKNSREKQGL